MSWRERFLGLEFADAVGIVAFGLDRRRHHDLRRTARAAQFVAYLGRESGVAGSEFLVIHCVYVNVLEF